MFASREALSSRWLGLGVLLGLVVMAVLVGVGPVSALGPSSGGVDIVDEATLGERSNQTVCDDDGLRCVDAVLENSAWRCSGVNASSFSCNVSFWLNLTVRGPSVCASGGINVTDELAPEACTSTIEPFEHEVGGPVTLTFDAGEKERLVNVSGETCLEDESGTVCGGWGHDPILLPSWEEWYTENPSLAWPAYDHQICLGDLDGLGSPGDVGPGCVSGSFTGSARCDGILENYHCVVTLDALVVTDGLGLCASLETDYAGGVWEVTCSFRQHLEGSSWEEDRITKRYEHDEIPLGGGTVVVEAELCGWAFRPFAQQYCEKFHKVVRLPGDPCACHGGTIESLSRFLESRANHTITTVNHTTAPSVYP